MKKVLIEIWAFITTEGATIAAWHICPWRVAGLAFFVIAVVFGFKALGLAETGAGPATVGVIAGLSGTFITAGTFLFGQAAQTDKNIRQGGGQ